MAKLISQEDAVKYRSFRIAGNGWSSTMFNASEVNKFFEEGTNISVYGCLENGEWQFLGAK